MTTLNSKPSYEDLLKENLLLKSSIDELKESLTSNMSPKDLNGVEFHSYITTLISNMNELKGTFNNFTDLFQNLEKKYLEIITITDLISSIAQSTKILSFNASIEAARAGDLGKGFGVVAKETRKLSEGTEKNAHDIRNVLDDMTSIIDQLGKHVTLSSNLLDKNIKSIEDQKDNINNISIS